MAAASGTVRLQRCVVSPAGRHSASLIFLHGSGDSGKGLRRWIKEVLNHDFAFQHIKVIYPTAPRRPYTPMKGGLSNVWFDRFKISNDCPEHLESIDVMCEVLTDLIDDEVKSGIKKNRILIGGFSMGGCMAMHLAYRNHRDVAGVFALSSFLNKSSVVYQGVQKSDGVLPELFQCHGTADELVLHAWAEETNSALKSLGVSTKFHSFPGLHHELSKGLEDERLARSLESRDWRPGLPLLGGAVGHTSSPPGTSPRTPAVLQILVRHVLKTQHKAHLILSPQPPHQSFLHGLPVPI
ncbi:lysophospholipase-like protein 1 isoform X1 [Pteropus alecto]|uniref:lysophospholipase-like protein 1 isoform X1 n=2 Tax=Pteropus alecto TaxID=9402 RepID=UPI000D535CEA|nr:lysophospholipase-like protein 1 isoform X1 [Pteropus alecto]